MRKYRKVIQNYHLKFLGGFDASQMREIVMVRPCSSSLIFLLSLSHLPLSLSLSLFVQRMTVCPEEESILMTSFVDALSKLQGHESSPHNNNYI